MTIALDSPLGAAATPARITQAWAELAEARSTLDHRLASTHGFLPCDFSSLDGNPPWPSSCLQPPRVQLNDPACPEVDC